MRVRHDPGVRRRQDHEEGERRDQGYFNASAAPVFGDRTLEKINVLAASAFASRGQCRTARLQAKQVYGYGMV